MSSFFEKLKKGMGIEITDEEPEKTEKTEEKPPKESPKGEQVPFGAGKLPTPVVEQSSLRGKAGLAKSSLKKRKIKKIEVDELRSASQKRDERRNSFLRPSPPFAAARVIETDLINKTEVKEPKKSEPREPEEKTESKQEIKKTSLAKIAQGKEDKSSSSTTESRLRDEGGKEREALFDFATARVKEEKKLESNRQGFTLQNLSGQEGQLAVDVYQTDAELVIQSTIAGVKAENLDISIEADTVLIKGSRNEPEEQGEKNYFHQECYWGPFSWQKILPVETDPSRASAELKEGILTIRIPKIEREKKRKITVKE